MPNAHRVNTIMSNAQTNGNNSLTFESIVCSQLELKRHAASFSRRRSTMCRRPSVYIPPATPTTSISQSNERRSSILPDISTQFLKARDSTNDNKRGRASSTVSIGGTGLEPIGERQSLSSIFYWDSSARNAAIKKVRKRNILFGFYFSI
jgi:hypothetical protein